MTLVDPYSKLLIRSKEKEAPPSVPPDTIANAETKQSPSVETIPELELVPEPEQKQGAEQDQARIEKTQTEKAPAFTLEGLCVNLTRTSDS